MKTSRSIYIFYILVGYIFVQFAWWGYHIMELNEEIVGLKIEMNVSESDKASTKEVLLQKLKVRKLMVVGEGSVFIILLLFGFYLMLKAFKQEVALSNQQKNFLMSVSHELKSPLTSIKLNLQTLVKHDLEKVKNLSVINSAIEDTERLQRLVDNILLATKIESGNYPLCNENINISKLLKEVAHFYKCINGNENDQIYRRIEMEIVEGVKMMGDEEALRSVFSNLIENSIKYSVRGSLVQINLLKLENKILCQVIDEGIGVNNKYSDKIFDKFYRIEDEVTRETKGTGLGLFIVKFFVDTLGGCISIRPNKPNGSVFEVSFDLIK